MRKEKATAATRQKQPNTTTNKRIPAVCPAQGKGRKNCLQNADANRHSHSPHNLLTINALQKGTFQTAKGVLLACNLYPFAT